MHTPGRDHLPGRDNLCRTSGRDTFDRDTLVSTHRDINGHDTFCVTPQHLVQVHDVVHL